VSRKRQRETDLNKRKCVSPTLLQQINTNPITEERTPLAAIYSEDPAEFTKRKEKKQRR
jgi:hypothetical protein